MKDAIVYFVMLIIVPLSFVGGYSVRSIKAQDEVTFTKSNLKNFLDQVYYAGVKRGEDRQRRT